MKILADIAGLVGVSILFSVLVGFIIEKMNPFRDDE